MSKKHQRSIIKIILLGAAVGFFIAAIVMYNNPYPKTFMDDHWIMKPLIILPILSAIGSIPFYFITKFDTIHSKQKVFSFIIATIVLLLSNFIGLLIGFNSLLVRI